MFSLRKVRQAIAALIAPKQSTALVPVHIPNGKWMQVIHGDVLKSYTYTCKCGQQQPLTVSEAKSPQIRKCGCGKSYDLLSDIGLTPASSISDYENALANVPAREIAVRAPQRRHVAVGDEPLRDPWSGRRDDARERAFDNSDPEMMGTGFSFPKR